MTGHVWRKLHPHSSLGSASVRTMCLDASVISVFQVSGDTEEIHLENAEVSFHFYQFSPGCFESLGCFRNSVTAFWSSEIPVCCWGSDTISLILTHILVLLKVQKMTVSLFASCK